MSPKRWSISKNQRTSPQELKNLYHYTHDTPPSENQFLHNRIRNGCSSILGGAKALEINIEVKTFKGWFSINHPSEFHSCILELRSGNDYFHAVLPFVKPAVIKNNGFDITENESENKRLFE